MNKMNKNGFTLIEMLVVIAIIAVLVSIIIPTVMGSTEKAHAATTAANLRSCKAEIVTQMLTNASFDATKYTTDAKFYHVDGVSDGKTGFVATPNAAGNDVTVTFGGAEIQDFADFAAGVKSGS